MSKKPLLSVCVTTYNHAKYIEECLDSILMQETKFSFEIIIGEDESSDGTREICESYKETFPDTIKLFKRSRNDVIYVSGKPTGRFNFMNTLMAASGKFIALCDGDDYWTDPLKLQKQVDFLESNTSHWMCFHGKHQLNDSTGEIIYYKKGKKPRLDLESLLVKWPIHTASIVLKRDVNYKFPYWIKEVASGDIPYIISQYDRGDIGYLDHGMSVYRANENSVRHTGNHKGIRMIHYRAKMYSYLNEFLEYKYEKEIYAALFRIIQTFGMGTDLEPVVKIDQVSLKVELQKRVKKLFSNSFVNRIN